MILRTFVPIALLLLAIGCTEQTEANPGASPSTASPSTASPSAESPTPATSETPSPPDEPVSAGDLEARPGAVGDAVVGMTVDEASATGLFNTGVEVGGDVCPAAAPLQWKAEFSEDLDVIVADERIFSIGILSETVKTQKGVGVGNTLGEVNDAYGDSISPAIEAGYGQMGVFVNTGDKWLGFLVDDSYSDVNPSSVVTFMEVTKGEMPLLVRDGC